MKTYTLHFRERLDSLLIDHYIKIQANSKKDAKNYGKQKERDNYWFMGIV